jgi:prolyl-tRNA synthetase
MMQNGWCLQSGTSHDLGQSFGKAFDVTFQASDSSISPVYGTSWGVTTRLIGAMIMTHSDDSGLVLPPKIAPKQVVIVPIPAKKNDEEGAEKLKASLDSLVKGLTERGVRVKVDDRDYLRNGAKYFEWERKGVPLRIEIGPRDVKNDVCVFKWRKWKEDKESVRLEDAADKVVEELEQVSPREKRSD